MWVIIVADIIEDGYGYARDVALALAVALAIAVGIKLHRTAWQLTRENFERHDTDNSKYVGAGEMFSRSRPSW